jgi:DNA repair protein RecO (recombination protein O)
MIGDGSIGIVLRTTPVREADLIVTLFTAELGRVGAVARGARRSQRRFANALSLLVLGRYHLGRRGRGDLFQLDGAETVRDWTPLASDVVAVAHASYAAELLGALLPPETPDPEALELVVALWDSLAATGASSAALRALELSLLDVAGHRPALERCAACGSPALDTGAVFDPDRGGAICRADAARSRATGVRPLEPATRSYLLAIAGRGPGEVRDVDGRFDPADRAAAREAIAAMILGLVGQLRSLDYLRKLATAEKRKAP